MDNTIGSMEIIMRFKNKKNMIFSGIYIFALLLFTLFVLLDTFVLSDEQMKINDTSSEDSGSSSAKTVTETSYSDENIQIEIQTLREYDTDIYIADIILNSIDYLKTAFANDTYGKNIRETTSNIAENKNAILAINGDYYGFRNNGFVLRNGVIYRDSARDGSDNEALAINADGSFSIIDENTSDLEEVLASGALQAFSFGPSLIQNHEITVTQDSEVSQSMQSNPRTAIGIIDNLHYIFLVSDGRTSANEGLSLYELAEIMQDLGCSTAYNLDGGGSSTMYFNGSLVNQPTSGHRSGERKVSDIVYIGY